MRIEAIYVPHAAPAAAAHGENEPGVGAGWVRPGRCGHAPGAALAAALLAAGAIAVIARLGQAGPRSSVRGPSGPRKLEDKVDAVTTDAPEADHRRMEHPLPSSKAPLPHLVEWRVTAQRAEGEQPLESQKFRLLKHTDGRISMKHAGDFHVDVANGTARAIAAVAGDGKLLRLPIRETGKFSLLYNFDDTVSLQHLDGHCLAANSDGGLSLASCDAKETPGAIFTPIIVLDEGTVAFKSAHGRYITVIESWVQDYRMSMVMVNKTVAEESPSQCAKFYKELRPNGLVALQTGRATFLSLLPSGSLVAGAAEGGDGQLFSEKTDEDGRVSVEPATGPGYVEVGDGGTSSIEMKSNADGSVSLTSGDDFLCSAERRVTVLTCETRKSNVESWPMQGVGATMTIHNVCFNKTWYGFKTKVDAYHERVMELTAGGQPEQLVVLVDNSDMAFGGCTYDDLLDRYDKISSLVNVPVIAGADNKLFPTTDWPYHTFEERRGRIMRAFGMTAGKFCKYTECPKYSYRFANSGFLAGPPKDLQHLLRCMLKNGWGDFGKTGYDDQQGLHACMFSNPDLVALDYTGTLSQQLIFFDDEVLYRSEGKVHNRVAGGVVQCFVHGNGDTMKTWWPKLFPGMNKTEDYGKAFKV